ncbi:MAG: hypothetical protein AAGB18_01495 [Pseudomonadota bacterium]
MAGTCRGWLGLVKPCVAGLFGVLVAGCGATGDGVSVTGPTTASSTIVDLPSASVRDSAVLVERRLRSAGVDVTAIDRDNGFIQARSSNPAFVDCGEIVDTGGGSRRSFPGNSARLELSDPVNPGATRIRSFQVVTTAGIGITQGDTNSVVIRQQHQATLTIQSGQTGATTLLETREFSDRGFASFADGTVCRSSDAMNRAVR